jgi:glycosyltransferase involved in cell wall biosynthesis
MGLPVITTTATAGEYIIEDGVDGLLVPPGDIDALKNRIALVYENRDLAEQMGRRAALKARRFTWENYGNGIVESVLKAWQRS